MSPIPIHSYHDYYDAHQLQIRNEGDSPRSQATPRFYLAAVEKTWVAARLNLGVAWEQV